MKINNVKLKVLILDTFKTYQRFGDEIGFSTAVLSSRLNGHTEFSQSEIVKICKTLSIDISECHLYFFNEYVQEVEQAS